MTNAEQEETENTEQEPKEVTINDLELERLRHEAEDYKDKYFRLLAESENTRKRMQKEKQDLTQFALQNLIVDFLGPIDQMENALTHADNMSDEIKHWAVGFKMILGHFKDVLANNNVHPFSSEGKTFDPHHHEAVEAVTSDEHPPETVIEELLRGYRMGERTIRPARVKVTKAQNEEKEEDKNNNIKGD